VDHDPSKEARAERKARVAKNEQQRMKNLARSQHGQAATGTTTGVHTLSERKGEIERSLAMTRASTASMGKFDRKLEGEKKPRGVKRKVSAHPSSPSRIRNPLVFSSFFFSLNRRKSRSMRRKARIWR
jgi:regulator of ribosome biosynthesis